MTAPPEQPTGLILDQITINLGPRRLLSLDLEIPPGDVLTVMGDSGSGKSTLLDFLAGFLSPAFSATGHVLLDGRDITELPPQARHIGLMFQAPLLFPHMSVAENLMFGVPQEKGLNRNSRRELALNALEEIGLAGFGDRDPATLSGGQQTRVALMRLLLAEPKTLLLDEPFSSLGQSRRADIRRLVFAMARKKKLPVLLVTHDPDDAEAAGGDIVQL
jgi:putative thiamine transport system ATP-binding protein